MTCIVLFRDMATYTGFINNMISLSSEPPSHTFHNIGDKTMIFLVNYMNYLSYLKLPAESTQA